MSESLGPPPLPAQQSKPIGDDVGYANAASGRTIRLGDCGGILRAFRFHRNRRFLRTFRNDEALRRLRLCNALGTSALKRIEHLKRFLHRIHNLLKLPHVEWLFRKRKIPHFSPFGTVHRKARRALQHWRPVIKMNIVQENIKNPVLVPDSQSTWSIAICLVKPLQLLLAAIRFHVVPRMQRKKQSAVFQPVSDCDFIIGIALEILRIAPDRKIIQPTTLDQPRFQRIVKHLDPTSGSSDRFVVLPSVANKNINFMSFRVGHA